MRINSFFCIVLRRKGFKLLIIFLALLNAFGVHHLGYRTIGCAEIIPQVMNVLILDNIGRGSFKLKLNPKNIATKIALNVDQAAWVGVEIKGVKLFITIKDSIEPPVLIKNNESFNIVAERDGLVKSMEVYAGRPLIKEGETVKVRYLYRANLRVKNWNSNPGCPCLGKIIREHGMKNPCLYQ